MVLTASLPLFAQDGQDDLAPKTRMDSLQHIGEVEVYGKRPLATSQKLSGADLQALSSTSVADALKYFSGVQIKDYGGLGGLKTVNVRSMGAQHVGIYVDGIRITNAQNGTVDLGKYSLSSMESVTLYNANKLDNCQSASEYASGATVYLQTRRPTKDSVSLQLRRASFSTWMVKGNAQFSVSNPRSSILNGWKGFVDGEWTDSRGDYPFRYHSEYEDTVGRRANSDIRYGRIEGALFKGGFSTHLYYYDSERGCPGGIVRRLSDKYVNVGREWDRDFFVQASWQQQFLQRHRVKANAKYTNEYLRYCTDYPENQNTARVDNHYRQEDGYGALCYGYTPWPWLSLSTSYDVRYSKLRADLKHFDNVFRLDQKEVVAAQMNLATINNKHETISFLQGFQAAVSMLHQHLHDFTFTRVGAADPLDRWTPAVSMAYTLFGVTLRAWYKKIFRAPTLNDLYYTQVGNRNLKPEYTKQWNIGAEWHWVTSRPSPLTSHLSFDVQADVYQNKIENRIVCLPLKGTYTWTMMNYGYTFCRGLNATVKGHYDKGAWSASLLGSLTWQRDLNRTDPDDEDTYNKPICYSPELSYTLTGIGTYTPCKRINTNGNGQTNTRICPYGSFSLTVSYMHVGERMWSYADPEDILTPYNNIDAKLSYTINRLARGRNGLARGLPLLFTSIGLCLEVCDVLDEQYEHIPRYPMPGRNYRLTLMLGL